MAKEASHTGEAHDNGHFLDAGDMDLERSLFVVRKAKFGKTRLVPFNARTREITSECLNRFRPADDGMPPDAPLFLSMQRRRFRVKNVRRAEGDLL